jgi:hypothetical protein
MCSSKKLDWWVDSKVFNSESSRFYTSDLYFDNDINSDNEHHEQMGLVEVYMREGDFERLYDNLSMSYKFPICDVRLNENDNNLLDITSFFLTKKHPLYISENFHFLRYDYTYDPVRLGRINVFLLRYPIIMEGLSIESARVAFECYKIMWDEYDFRFNEWQNEIRRNTELVTDVLNIINTDKKNIRATVRLGYRKCKNAIWSPSEHFLDFNYSKDPLKFVNDLHAKKGYKKPLKKEKPIRFKKIDYNEILKKFF